jgi:hypothetical protein
MSGMLPNQDYSRLVTQDRERETREHVGRRSQAAARTSAADRASAPGEPRPRVLGLHVFRHLHLRHHGPAVHN